MSAVGMDAILANQAKTDTTVKSDKANTLGKEAFFNLLVKQLQYQDPLNPVENTEFTGQLAQFTSLETLSRIDTNLQQFASLQTSTNNIQAVSFIGKSVNAQGNILHYTSGDATINYKLDDSAEAVALKIFTEDGSLVRTVDLQGVPKGDAQYVWNGRDDDGQAVDGGRYRFTIEAFDYEGKRVGTSSYVMGEVTGVRYDNGTTYLIIGDKEVTISDIEKIQG